MATLSIEVNEEQARLLKQSLIATISSLRAFFMELHRENARWETPETQAVLSKDQRELHALECLVEALSELQAKQGWKTGQ